MYNAPVFKADGWPGYGAGNPVRALDASEDEQGAGGTSRFMFAEPSASAREDDDALGAEASLDDDDDDTDDHESEHREHDPQHGSPFDSGGALSCNGYRFCFCRSCFWRSTIAATSASSFFASYTMPSLIV